VRQRNSRASRLISHNDVSALAAVMFVLVFAFIFLTATPLHGWPSALPVVRHPRSMPGGRREDALIVSIQRDSTIYFGKDKTMLGGLPAQIREGVAHGAEKKIYIRADARARYGTVREVLDEIGSSGVEKVAFLLNQRTASFPSTRAQ
jgi:biopolymer transport protein TolR